ncbi:MAG: hypothetical protein LBD73_07520 [Deferribacteraceae bacterium]|nr:hypothetical protein [Deferribacteraceae bacterium]
MENEKETAEATAEKKPELSAEFASELARQLNFRQGKAKKKEKAEKRESAGQELSAQRELAPIRAEIEKLKELKRDIVFEKVKLMHPELVLQQARDALKELEKKPILSYSENGLSKEKTDDLAKKTAAMWVSE